MPSSYEISATLTARADSLERGLKAAQQGITDLNRKAMGLQQSLGRTSTEARQTASALGQIASSSQGLSATFTRGIGQLGAYGLAFVGLHTAVQTTQKILQIGIQHDQLVRAFTTITGSSEAARKELEFVRTTANTLGQSVLSLADAYKGLSAASRGTILEGQQTRDLFVAIGTAGNQLGLSSDQLSGALQALQQIISKGTVQSEELRGQLGERLPGAFQIAARAMGVTTAQLGKMLEQGEVLSTEFIPRFTAQLTREFAPAAEGAAITASQGFARLGNTLRDLVSGPGQALSQWIGGIASGLAKVGEEGRKAEGRLDALAKRDVQASITKQTQGLGLAPTPQNLSNQNRLEELRKQILQEEILLEQLRFLREHPEAQASTLNKMLGIGGVSATMDIPGAITGAETRLKQQRLDAARLEKALIPAEGTIPGFDMPLDQGSGLRDAQQAASSRESKILENLKAIAVEAERARQGAIFLGKTSLEQAQAELAVIQKGLQKFHEDFADPKTGMLVFPPGKISDTGIGLIKRQTELIQQTGDMKAGLKDDKAEERERHQAAKEAERDNERALEKEADTLISAREDLADVTNDLFDSLKTGTTALDAEARALNFSKLEALALTGEYEKMLPVLEDLETQIGKGNVRLTEQERAMALARLESIHGAQGRAEWAREQVGLAQSLEDAKKAIEAWLPFAKTMAEVERTLADIEAERFEGISNIVESMQNGLSTLEEWERLYKRLQGLGAGEATLAVAKKLREELTPAAQALRTLAEDLAQEIQSAAISAFTPFQSLLGGGEDLQAVGDASDDLRRLEQERETILQGMADHPGNDRWERALAKINEDIDKARQKLEEFQETAQQAADVSGNAWVQFGDRLSQMFLKAAFDSALFQEKAVGWLETAGKFVVGLIGAGAGAAGGGGGGGDITQGGFAQAGLQHGGPVSVNQQNLTGEAGMELLVTPKGMQLVGVHGPEVIIPRSAGFVIPHRETMTILRESRALTVPQREAPMRTALVPSREARGFSTLLPQRTIIALRNDQAFTAPSSVQAHAARAMGGPVLAGQPTLVGETAMPGQQPRGGNAARSSGGSVVHVHVHDVRDARSFLTAEGQIKRAMARMVRDADRST